MGGKKTGAGHHLASRVKKIMQKDEEVGKIAQATPVLICRAMELLLKKICEKTFDIANARQAKTVNASHVKACVMSDEMMDFLKDTVAAAPDLAPEEAAPAKPAPKRRRAAAGGDDSDGSPSEKPKKPRAPRGSKKKENQEGADGDAAPTPKRRGRKKAQPEDAQAADAMEEGGGQLAWQGSDKQACGLYDVDSSAAPEHEAMGAAVGMVGVEVQAVAPAAVAAVATVASLPVPAVAESKSAGKLSSLRPKHPFSLKPGKKAGTPVPATPAAVPASEQPAEAEPTPEVKAEEGVQEEVAHAEQLPVLPALAQFAAAAEPAADYDDDYDA